MLEKITGGRIILRTLRMSDAEDIYEYCKDREVSRYTQNMPYPYKRKYAAEFIKICEKNWKQKTGYTYGIEYNGKIIGNVGLAIKPGKIAEMGYSLSREYWGKGIMTEASKLMLREAFKRLKLHKIYATHHPKNPASGKVMQKTGMKYEGLLREHSFAKGKYWDLVQYGILRREYRG